MSPLSNSLNAAGDRRGSVSDPLCGGPAGLRASEEERVAGTPGILPARKVILVVEDEILLRRGVATMLEKRGFSVVEASDGSSALDVVRTRQGAIDVLILDISLPGTPSREVYEEARRLRPGLPVIVTSGSSQRTAAASLAAEIRHFLRKPFTIAELLHLIGQVLAS
jgi:CheY-like chemotaxis protein